MPERTEQYKGKTIVIEENDISHALNIDGKQISSWYDEEAKKYRSVELPYREYDLVIDLAKEIIDTEQGS